MSILVGSSTPHGPASPPPRGGNYRGSFGRGRGQAVWILPLLVVASLTAASLVGAGGSRMPPNPRGPAVSVGEATPPIGVLPLLPFVLTPNNGPAGTLVTANGIGFGPNASIGFTFSGQTVESNCSADGSGDFPGITGTACTLNVPTLADGTYNVVASEAENAVAAASPSVGRGPTAIAYDAGDGELFVANFYSNNVSVINDTTDEVVATVAVGTNPAGVAYDPGTNMVYVADYSNGSLGGVSVISDRTNTVVASVPVGIGPTGIAYDRGTSTLYVANSGGNVSVISDSTNSVIATVPTGVDPYAVAYDSGTSQVFVTDRDYDSGGSVSVIDDSTNLVVRSIGVGVGPIAIAYDSGKGEVFVANYLSDDVSVIADSSDAVVATVPVQTGPSDVAYDSAKAQVFVPIYDDGFGSTVEVISDATNSVVANLTVGTGPSRIAYDPGRVKAYVTNFASDNLTVISTGVQATVPFTVAPPSATYTVTFAETGLPANTTWSVTTYAIPSGASAQRITINAALPFSLGNGTFSYVIAPVARFAPTVLGGRFTVDGSAISIPIPFVAGIAVTFLQSGGTGNGGELPPASWTVTVNGGVFMSTTSSVALELANGTFSFGIALAAGYVPIAPLGTVVVNATPLTVPVPIAPTSDAYAVAFAETGLPSGTAWSVTVAGFTAPASNSTLTLLLENGTSGYAVHAPPGYTARPSNGTVSVAGSRVTQPVSFASTSSASSSPPWEWLLIGALVAVVIVATAVLLLRRRAPPAPPPGDTPSGSMASGVASAPPSTPPSTPPTK